MIVAIEAVLNCLVTGLFAGLTLWGLARLGLIPVVGVMVVKDEDEV